VALLDDNLANDLIAKTTEIQKMVFSLGNKIRKV